MPFINQNCLLEINIAEISHTFVPAAMTFLVSACSRNTSVAGALLSSYATTLFFFSGFLIPFPLIVKPWRWYSISELAV